MAKEYIDREDAIFCFCFNECARNLPVLYEPCEYPCDAVTDIKNLPAADVAPVVRCKDCKYYHLFEEGFYDCRNSCGMDGVKPYDFCSYGERR